MKNTILFLLLFVLNPLWSTAQDTGGIFGKVVDENQEPLAYANVLLYNALDSIMVKAEVTNNDGLFHFYKINDGNYYLKVSYIGLEDYQPDGFAVNDGLKVNLDNIKLISPKNELSEVTVKAQRRMIEVRPGKVVFNIDKSINSAGSDGLELIRKSPGVILDHNENITLMGKSGVRVYINDRPSSLRGTDLSSYLRSLNSSDIDKIEIISTPGARYEAEGGAGIINIVLKKNENIGTNGAVSLTGRKGVREKYDGQLRLNHKNKYLNIFGSIGYGLGEYYNFENLDRQQFDLFFNQKGEHFNGYNTPRFRVGMDFYKSKNQTFGIIISGNKSKGTEEAKSSTDIGNVATPSQIDSILIARTEGDSNSENLDMNLNYQFKGDNDLLWNFDANYGSYTSDGNHTYPNSYTSADGNDIFNDENYSDQQATNIKLYSFKVDFEKNIGEGKLGLGVKSVLVDTDNQFSFFDVENSQAIIDSVRSNDFTYYENVNAAYSTYTQKFGKWGVQAGLRMEHSNTKGVLRSKQILQDSTVKRNYLDFFPSFGLTYELNPTNQFQLSYSSSIDRPNYANLNPFRYLVNELTASTGNPFLRPQYTHSIQITHTFNYSFNTTLKYSVTKDLMTRFSAPDGIKGEIFTWDNLPTQKNLSLNIAAPFAFTKWWNTYSSFTAFALQNDGDLGDGNVVNLSAEAINVFSQHTFTLPHDFTFEVSGWYGSGGIWGGNFKTSEMWAIDAGFQKKLFNGNGVLKIGVTDIFKTSQWSAEVDFGELYITGYGGWDSQQVYASFVYNFGNQKVKTRKRKTGLEEEAGRAGGSE